jgi:hypothetical protein
MVSVELISGDLSSDRLRYQQRTFRKRAVFTIREPTSSLLGSYLGRDYAGNIPNCMRSVVWFAASAISVLDCMRRRDVI